MDGRSFFKRAMVVILNASLFGLAPSDGTQAISHFLSVMVLNPAVRDILAEFALRLPIRHSP